MKRNKYTGLGPIFMWLVLMWLVLGGGVAGAGDEYELHSDRAREVLSKYNYTGEAKLCLRSQRIKYVDILDDWTLLIEMAGKDYYVNHLTHRCPGLKLEDRFSYTLRGLTQLCNTDVITVLHTDFIKGASCGLGKFEKLQEK